MAIALSAAEPDDRGAFWADRFLEMLEDFKFVPRCRIQAGVGTSAMSPSLTAS
jgi:hypothetical protein